MSTLAGEVANPHKTFPRALMLAVILVILMYLLPLAACLGVMTDADWKLGFFATVARQVGGQWLAWWMLAAAAVSATPLIMTWPASPSLAQSNALQGGQVAAWSARHAWHAPRGWVLGVVIIM